MSDLSAYQHYLPLVKEAFRRNKALVKGLNDTSVGRPSFWQGKSVGRYIEKFGPELSLSKPFPADFVNGT